IERVVLGAAAEDLDGPAQLAVATDQRIDLAGAGLVIEVDAEIGEGRTLLALSAAFRTGLALFRATDLALFARAGLGNAVGDEVHRIEPAHVLLLEEICGMALALGENGDEHVCPSHLFATGGLDMDDRALND